MVNIFEFLNEKKRLKNWQHYLYPAYVQLTLFYFWLGTNAHDSAFVRDVHWYGVHMNQPFEFGQFFGLSGPLESFCSWRDEIDKFNTQFWNVALRSFVFFEVFEMRSNVFSRFFWKQRFKEFNKYEWPEYKISKMYFHLLLLLPLLRKKERNICIY